MGPKGPLDVQRETELNELEAEISDPERYRGIEYQLVEDSLEAALLARGLERPRIEVDGRFDRAARLAEKHGSIQQRLRVSYHRAWTVFWWYEDYATFIPAYEAVEQLTIGTSQADDTELLKNLWQLLRSAAGDNRIDPASARVAEKTTRLKNELDRLEGQVHRPATALQARAQRLLVNLCEIENKSHLSSLFGQFIKVVEDGQRLVDFPTRALIDLIMEVSELLPTDEAFDEQFESMLAIANDRDSSATAGRMLLRRGMHKIEHQHPYEAIRLLGRAQQSLALRECRFEFVTALALCSRAYEAAGLLWAARASMLLAASQAMNRYWEDGTVTGQAYRCLRRLPWLEAQLGRVTTALAAISLLGGASHAIKLASDDQEALREEFRHLDFYIGLLVLKTDHSELKNIAALAAAFDRLGLDFSWISLLYALGHEDRLRTDGIFPPEDGPDDVLSSICRGRWERRKVAILPNRQHSSISEKWNSGPPSWEPPLSRKLRITIDRFFSRRE